VAQRPYVFVNMAMTADGKIDTVERQGARISGAADTARVDRLRAGADAVMVGGHTLFSEDPRLTVRDPELVARRVRTGREAQPVKVGVSSRVEHSGARSLRSEGDFVTAGDGRVLLCTSSQTDARTAAALAGLGIEVIVAGDDRVDLKGALSALAERGVERLMVEGGSTLVAALLEAGLVDELQLAVAPLVFGGETAPTPVGGPGWSRAEARDLFLVEAETSTDGDVVLRYLTHGGPAA
jgi:2,5-diamino-6-(ribosylamino)-4(3H)-pyrimidinone 5'-phosphate reductase